MHVLGGARLCRPLPSPAIPGFTILAAVVLLMGPTPALADPMLEWSDLYDGAAHWFDLGTAVVSDPQGDVFVGGESADGVDGIDMLVRRLDRASGATLWTRRVPSFDTNDMALSEMAVTSGGDVLVGGYVRGCVG